MEGMFIFMLGLIGLIFLQAVWAFTRYKKCIPNKLLVVYGKLDESGKESVKIIKKGGAFVWPVIQDFTYLDMRVYISNISLGNGLEKATFSYGIAQDETIQANAITRLMEMENKDVQTLAESIIKDRIGASGTLNRAEIETGLNQIGMELIAIENH